MNKTLKLALLPAAVASAMFANSALAGTEACFETYKGADGLAVDAFTTIYGNAACVANRTGASATNLAVTDEGKIAYELTGNLAVDFDELDGTDTDQHIVYIPTTDIPGGTKIQMELSGAKFFGNNNQIHLVKGNTTDTTFEAVASSDGQVDGQSTITFLTKAGITIPAGARLAFSLVSTGPNATAVKPIGIKLKNTECTNSNSTQSVTIKATYARTDGGTGYNIIGGISQAQKILDISPQFYAFQDGSAAEVAEVNVNAESSNDVGTPILARAEFVYDSAITNQLVAKRYEAVYKTAFYDRGSAGLDRFITLDANDHVETSFTASSDAGESVKMALWNSRTATTGALADQIDVETGTTLGLLDATVYNTEATDLFAPATTGDAEVNLVAAKDIRNGANYNQVFYVLTNTNPDSIMNFNYDVKVNHTLDFGTASEIDHCTQNLTSHEIGVNGAVLKVPYAYNTDKNWVRITNEHSANAEVTVDVFGETVDGSGTEKQVFKLGNVAAKDSVVYKADEIIAQYKEAYTGDATKLVNRYTFTFTVTAPKDTVHAVSVQAIPGGVDRVMPVLDQNNWSQ